MSAAAAAPPSYAAYPSLAGKAVFITGGGDGIGAALTEAFCQQGDKVAFVDIDVARSRSLVDRLADGACPPLFLPCDLKDIAALREAVETAAERLGPIGVQGNNASND